MRHLLRPTRSFLPGLLLALLALLASGPAPAADDLVLKGDANCTRCHNEDDKYPVLAIGKTRHGTLADERIPTCTTCHGESQPHTLKLSAKEIRTKPERYFGKRTTTPVELQNATCLTCHQGAKRILWQGSPHATHDVSCASCHQIHTAHDRVRDKLTQPDTCFACHKEQRAQINQPWHHPVAEGKVACSDCHNVHGSNGPALMARNSVNDTCYTCHMEKRGPFVRNHQPVQENCAICHNPHGSTNPGMLKTRAPFICQQCHEPLQHEGTIPGNVTGTGTALNRVVANARNCMNCHISIHGTNSPANTAGERSFRR